MKFFANTFFKGLLALLPLLLTVYGMVVFVSWLNRWTNALLGFVFTTAPEIPGLGILVGAGLVFALGLVVSTTVTRRIYELIELPFKQLPIIKDLYTAIKQLTVFLAPAKDKRTNLVVRVRHPAMPVELIGLLTRDNLAGMPEGITQDDKVAVYLPMSYQIGGYTLFVPRAWVEPLEISVEQAMRETLTGWLEHSAR